MRRRDFLGSTAALWATATFAQKQKVHRIGVLNSGNPEPFFTRITDALRAEGYEAGKNAEFILRSDKGQLANLSKLAAELVALKVDVIVASPTPAVTAAHRATTTIPIVMAPAGDPVGSGFVASLARPGGNVTGMSFATAETAAKCIEIIKEAMPSARRIAVLANRDDGFTAAFLDHISRAARTLGLQSETISLGKMEEIEPAFANLVSNRPDFLMVQPSLPGQIVAEHAFRARMPTISPSTFLARRGGLIGYSGNFQSMYRDAANYVGKLLKGAKPADLPVQLPRTYDLLINMKTAKAIGFEVPRALLIRAELLE